MTASGKLSRRALLAASAALPVGAAGAGSSANPGAAASGENTSGENSGQDRAAVPGADVLAAQGWRLLAGRRAGLVTNPTGVLRDLTHVVDAAVGAGVRLVAVFGPEHGFRGTAQAGGSQGDYVDPRTGIPVYDAYGASADALAGMYRKAGVDTVVFDIADVGARFYTYIWTMYTAMHAAVLAGASFVVLDRPNPIGGQAFGPQLDPAYASAVGRKPVVAQHGMTVGELAALFDAEFLPSDAGGRLLSLEVVRVLGWRRQTRFDGTGLRWTPPSPNMPTADTALVYPGTCLFEGTTFAEGRGTTRPFETVGAPGVDWRLAETLNGESVAGVRFREVYFVPAFSKHQGTTCGGVQLYVTDPSSFDAIRTAVAVIVAARRLYPSAFGWRADNWIDRLSGSDRLRRMVDAGAGVEEIVGAWQPELARFRRQREPYLLYQ